MSPRLNRVWLLVPFLLLASRVWALGLGDIRLSSALNEPLRAEIELLAATPEELNNLAVQLASQETFRRYDLDRPLFLSNLQFQIIRSGRADGNVIRITSTQPITEPFVTFLVEASWSRGRLLREYTLLLDPPTFAPPPTTQATETVTAPTRTAPADAGEIQRSAPRQEPARARPPARQPIQPPVQVPTQAPVEASEAPPQRTPEPADTTGRPDFDAAPGGDVLVVRGDTLWGITQRVRPDSRLTINQTMLAIFQANPDAFNGNINRLRAGATLRIPSADDIFRIGRSDAFAEVQRQNNEWQGQPAVTPTQRPVQTQPSLELVPPDEEDEISLSDTSVDTGAAEATETPVEETPIDPVAERISEIEAILQDQDALIEIPDNELAALRQELAELRGEELPEVEETPDEEIIAEDETPVDEDETAAPQVTTAPPVVSRSPREESIVDLILGYLNNFWVWIGAALLATVGILVWFMRRAARRDDEDATGVWDALDADEMDHEAMASTERLRALARDDDESFVVVETEAGLGAGLDDFGETMEIPESSGADYGETLEIPSTPDDDEPMSAVQDTRGATGAHKTLEDTFSSETAINLDQTDPVAEADFHMAYGLYDQAADLINGALEAEPKRQDLLSKLCEIYFVWGNRDAFIDAASRMKAQIGGASNPEWDKIVIMGQQIAGDHSLFSGVSAEGVTKAVDLSFESDMDDAGALDIDFAGSDDGGNEVIDLGGSAKGDIVADETGQVLIPPDSGTGIDFSFDDEDMDVGQSATREMPGRDESPTIESTADGGTDEMPAARSSRTSRTPTIEQQFDMEATGELPALDDEDDERSNIPSTEATAEIDLDDLGLDLDSLEESALGGDFGSDDSDDTVTGQQLSIDEDDLSATGRNPALADDDMLAATGRSKALEDEELEETSTQEVIDIEDALAATGELPSLDDDTTGLNRALRDDDATQFASLDDDDDEDTDIGVDTSLLDATGQTQILTEDMAVETATDLDAGLDDGDATMLAPGYGSADDDALSDDAATLLASLDDDEDGGDFDFAKTEALPKDVFSPDMSTDETGRMPGLAGSTDMDLDLDDLTAALKVSEVGDTVNQVRDEATVQQPRLRPGGKSDSGSTSVTQSLSPNDMSDDLLEARTMTEVGTKLDLARAYVDMGDPAGARSILEEVLDEGDAGQKQQARQLLESLPS